MANSIKYSTGSESESLRKGNFHIGTGAVGKGPTNVTGFYNGVTPPSGGYTIYIYNSSQPGDLSYHTVSNDSELISFTNSLAGQSYTTAQECFDYYYGQTDKVLVNQDYPADYPYIVMDGLVLNLDAGITQSYPGSGTAWTDVNGLGPKNNGTLTNGPTFSTDGGGSIVFDGSDDFINGEPSNGYGIVNNVTLECWFRTTATFGTNSSTTAGRIINLHHLSPGTNINIQVGSDGLGFYHRGNARFYVDNTNVSTGNWIHGVVVVNGTNTKLYRNNNVVIDINGNNISSFSSYPLKISSYDGISRFFNGDLPIVKIYNRALSSSEINQNYNATKGRFGL